MMFTLDDDFGKLDWHVSGGQKPPLTEQQAMIVAVASIGSALENIASQIHNALGPLQEIASALRNQTK